MNNMIYSSNLKFTNKFKFSKYRKGFSVVEVIISISIISIIMISISSVYTNLVQLSYKNTDKLQAAFILDEGVEILKILKKQSWSNVSSSTINTNYYFIWLDNQWQSTTTPVVIDNKFSRTFNIQNVYRDNDTLNIISDTNGFLDENSRLININVEWFDNSSVSTNTKKISFYVFNIN